MSDPMKDSFKYSELANKYGNFRVPAVKITINGSDPFDATKTYMGDLSVSLSLSASNSISFKVIGGYDKESRCFKDKVKSTFCLGQIIKAELGYVSDTTLIFKGFITASDMEFSTEPELKITALDVRRLMMQGKRSREHKAGEKYSDIVGTIMKSYSGLCTLEAEDTTTKMENTINQADSDYNFIKGKLLTGREFFVFGEKAYYRKPMSVKAPIMTLEWGENLLSFSRRSSYINVKVNVCGYDSTKQEAFTENVEIKGSSDQKSATSSEQDYYNVDTTVKNSEEAKKNAEKIAEEKKKKNQMGSGSCIGLPEIVPGRFIKLDKLDSTINANYYIIGVNHSFGSGGFQTSFEIGGWV